ncbi:hypothetical protein C8N40_11718 [Pontibacter mucosus]|uniref:Uncharacterized protein n=1 Tax=Pontibacter mucosus TaxID=1649266 RepID=A0A2T5Y3A2_9BACT|nr:hypothetical protein [Pontibacter mucosus]PTX10517.1 hypothetical protein C8N40_11718 [Pontibacter mucosus]
MKTILLTGLLCFTFGMVSQTLMTGNYTYFVPVLFSLGVSIGNYNKFRINRLKGLFLNAIFSLAIFFLAILFALGASYVIGFAAVLASGVVAALGLYLLDSLIFKVERKGLGLIIILASSTMVLLLLQGIRMLHKSESYLINEAELYVVIWMTLVGIGFGIALNLKEESHPTTKPIS